MSRLRELSTLGGWVVGLRPVEELVGLAIALGHRYVEPREAVDRRRDDGVERLAVRRIRRERQGPLADRVGGLLGGLAVKVGE